MRHTWVLTTAAASATSRIEIGTVGTNPYTTDPSEIATYIATLDELSGGRALLGLGLHTGEMVEWTGIDTADVIQRTREAVEIIRRLLRREVVEYAGQVFQWTDQCYLRFTPLRSEIPIYVAAFGEDYLQMAGAVGDGALPMMTPPQSAPRMIAPIKRGAEQSGRDFSQYVVSGCTWLSLSETPQAAADMMRHMVAYFGPYLEDEALRAVGLSATDFLPIKQLIDAAQYEEASAQVTDAMLQLGIVGTPQQVIQQIEKIAEAGVAEINLGGPLGPDPTEAIRLMGREVIPYFRKSP
jgi:5,10-methylenetetrahydromethanopterin reductase